MANQLHWISRTVLGLFLAAAGILKLTGFATFIDAVGQFGLLPDSLVSTAAAVICFTEMALGIGLCVNARRSLAATVFLLLLFVAVLTYGIRLGLDIDCGCLGPGYHVTLQTQRWIDFGLLAWCLLIFLTRPKDINKDRSASAAVPPKKKNDD